MNGDMLAGDYMRRLDSDLLQVDAEMWAKYSQLDMNIFRQFVQDPYRSLSFLLLLLFFFVVVFFKISNFWNFIWILKLFSTEHKAQCW